MTSDESVLDPVAPLAEEFAARYRRGERPALSEYVQKYPELAEQIRQVFPLVVLMEEAGPSSAASSVDGSLPANPVSEPLAAPPGRIGNYRILREVGRGGMGVVYEAEQVALGRHVALKVLPLHLARQGNSLERFRREARAAARLHHSNIVPIYDVGEDGAVCYYAMQYIHGQPLDEVLGELVRLCDGNAAGPAPPKADSPGEQKTVAASLIDGWDKPVAAAPAPLPERTTVAAKGSTVIHSSRRQYYRSVARLGVQVAEALAYAHQEGVLHRDIKPSNLLLDGDGRVWVADFGLAKTDGEALTQAGDVVGTIPYMAPERFRGWSDPRSDVYSLGLTLYEMVALRPAFLASDRFQLIHQVTTKDPPRLRKLDAQVPRDLATIIAKAIDKEPSRRYQTAGDLAADLQRFLDDRPIVARQSGVVERVWRWCRRNTAVSTLAVAVLLVALTGFAGVLVQWREAVASEKQADLRRREAERNLDRAREAEEKLGERFWQARFNEAQWLGVSGRAGQRFDSLAIISEIAAIRKTPPLRDLTIACLARTDVRLTKEWDGFPTGTKLVAMDQRFVHYARDDARGNLSVRLVSGDRELYRLPGPGFHACHLRFSADGHYLAAVYGELRGSLRVWDLRRCDKPILELPVQGVAFDFTPDSRRVAIGQHDDTIVLYELSTGRVVRRLGKGMPPDRLAISPDGTRVAVTSHWSRGSEVRSLRTGQVLATFSLQATEMAWHPHDPDVLAVSGWGITLLDVRTGKPRVVLQGPAGVTTNVAFNHKGDLLASKGWGDYDVRLWDPWTGRQLVRTTGGGSAHPDIRLQFSPDDRWLAFACHGSKLGLWEVEVSAEYRSLAGGARLGEGSNTSIDISPDSQVLAAGSRDTPRDGVRLWALETGRELAFLPIGWTSSAVFQPPRGEALITAHGEGGVYSWPIRIDRTSGTVWHVGPPRRLDIRDGGDALSFAQDGRLLAVVRWGVRRCIVLDLSRPGGKLTTMELDNPTGTTVRLSPDGRWAATTNYHGRDVEIRDARTNKFVKTLPAIWSADAMFSPDGRWLVIGVTEAYRIYEVGSWRLCHEIPRKVGGDRPGAIAFRSDSKVLAVHVSGAAVELRDPTTARVLATLEPPDPDRGNPNGLVFSPDGSRLAISTGDLRIIHIWDLRLVAKQLAEMGQPWEVPPCHPPVADVSSWRVEVHLGVFAGRDQRKQGWEHLRAGALHKAVDAANRAIERFAADEEAWRLRAEARMRLKQYDQALADYQHALTLGPRNAETENNLAWSLVVAPGVDDALVARAVKLAQGATTLAPALGTYWTTLGVAHYRAGNWDEAIRALRKSINLLRGRDRAHNDFFLSMAYAKRGDRSLARRALETANDWMEKHEPDNSELRRFRDEAAACVAEVLRQELDKLTRAIALRPKDAKVYFERGEVHFHLRQYAQARDDYSQALVLNSGHVGAYHQRGHTYQRLGQFDKMRADFAEALRRTPDEAPARGTRAHFHDMLGLAHYRLKEHAKASAEWQKSLDLMPKQPHVCRDLAWLYVTGPDNLRDAAKALPLAQRADQLAPGNYSYQHALGVVYYRLGQYEKAVTTLNRAAEARRQGPTAWDRFFLAMSYHRQGEAARARACYDEAVAWCQAHPELSAFHAEQLRAIRAEAEALLKP